MAGGVRPRPRRRGLAALAAAAGLGAVGWLAPTPWLADHWPRVLAVALFLVVFVLPRWLAPARTAGSLAGVDDPAARGRLEDERLKLQNEVRTGLLQALAGVAVIAAVVATWQQLDADRGQLRAQLALAGQEQAAERFARAVDQLASDRLDVRLGGVYGLEGVAARTTAAAAGGAYRLASPEDPAPLAPASGDRVQVFEILSAYVRRASRQPPVGAPGDPSLPARLPDVQAAVTVLGRRTVLAGDPPLDLRGALLPGARLDGARLAAADLAGADVRAASLQRAQLAGADLEGALLCGAQLQGADLRGARLAGARANAATRWPSGFDWRAAGARQVEVCQA
jgi:Pentapeptide repeats (8 copies)